MPGSYTLELELFSLLNGSTSDFEIWAEGSLLSSHSVNSTGSTISVTIPFGGAMPSSLAFEFSDTDGSTTDQIEIRSVKINNQHVNIGNFLSSNILNDGDTATVNVTDGDFVFDNPDPAASEFTTGATQTFTAGEDFYNNFDGTTAEIFDTLGGNDYAHTGSGDDKIAGGAGNDVLRGGAGNDLIFGGADNDRLYGMDGDDRLYGGTGDDRLYGNDGNDELYGGDGDDRLVGHDGEDILTGGAGADKLTGGSGVDFLFGGDDNDQLTGGSGDDTLDGGDGDDLIYGGIGDDHINGGDGADQIIGQSGVDIIHGDDGNDIIYLNTGDFVAGEQIYGGAGSDTLILTRAMTVDFTTGVIDGLEILTGSTADQDVTYRIEQALSFASIDLNGGNDTTRVQIDGTVDVTALGTPTVTDVENGFLTGSTGDDDLTISGAQLDALVFGAGTIDFDTGADILRLTSTSASLNALGATDGSIVELEEIDASTVTAGVTIDLNGQTEDFIINGGDVSLASNDIITAGSGNDQINGGLGDDQINSGDGDDFIDGGNSVDTILGGMGDDTILGGAGDDIIDGGAGNDTIYGDRNDSGDFVNEDDIITGGSGADMLFGEVGDDTFNLANGDFEVGEIIDGGSTDETSGDEIVLTNATTVNFTTGTVTEIETLTGSTGDDDVTIEIGVLGQFTTVNLAGGGNDTIRTQIDGAYDAVTNGVPTVTNAENGFLIGSAGNDTLTATGAQLDALVYGAGTIDFAGGGTDILNLTSTSVNLNTLGATDGSIVGLEEINASTAATLVTIDLSGQTEAITVTGSDILPGGVADVITTGAGGDIIFGLQGNDVINAGAGNDTIDGGLANDTVNAGDGDDVIIDTGGVDSDDTVTGGAGMDTINSGEGDDTINLANGDFVAGESIDGDDDDDELVLTDATTVDFTTGTLANLETLTGSAGDDDVTIEINPLGQFVQQISQVVVMILFARRLTVCMTQ